MKTRISVVMEYSKGRTFEEAVANLFTNGLMNGIYNQIEAVDREHAKLFRSWFHEISREAEVRYIVTEKYDEEYDEWWIDYSEGVEVLPCH